MIIAVLDQDDHRVPKGANSKLSGGTKAGEEDTASGRRDAVDHQQTHSVPRTAQAL
jgi:hypothetical protein